MVCLNKKHVNIKSCFGGLFSLFTPPTVVHYSVSVGENKIFETSAYKTNGKIQFSDVLIHFVII